MRLHRCNIFRSWGANPARLHSRMDFTSCSGMWRNSRNSWCSWGADFSNSACHRCMSSLVKPAALMMAVHFSFVTMGLFGVPAQADAELAQLALRNGRGGVAHQVRAARRLGERDHVANRTLARQNHHQAV